MRRFSLQKATHICSHSKILRFFEKGKLPFVLDQVLFQSNAPRVSTLATFTGELISIQSTSHCCHGKSRSLETTKVERLNTSRFQQPTQLSTIGLYFSVNIFLKTENGAITSMQSAMQSANAKVLTRNINSSFITTHDHAFNHFCKLKQSRRYFSVSKNLRLSETDILKILIIVCLNFP